MFSLNLAYQWTHAGEIDDLNGYVLLPSGNDHARLTRNPPPENSRLIFDPQLYLAELDATTCAISCSRLATYPWFGANIEPFDSSECGKREWDKKVRERIGKAWRGRPPNPEEGLIPTNRAIEFQMGVGCTHILLPCPLIADREDEADTQAQWIDHGLQAAADLEVAKPLLATVAVSEAALNDGVFAAGGFLDTIVDQITAREGITGVYILVVQTHAEHPFATDSRVLRCYLHLCRAFRKAGYKTVLVNFADVFGKVCMAVGASGFIAGASHSLRRQSFEGLEERSGGRAYPKFYSDISVGEFLSETHLDRVVANRLLRRVYDQTPVSQILMERLEEGGSASSVFEWAENQSNLKASQAHFLSRLTIDGNVLHRMTLRQRREYVSNWLDDAIANGDVLRKRMPSIDPDFALAPIETWRNIFAEYR